MDKNGRWLILNIHLNLNLSSRLISDNIFCRLLFWIMLLHIHRCWANQTKSCLNHWDVIILSWLSCSITLVGGIKCIFPYSTWRWWYPMTFLRNHQPNGMYTVWCCGSWLYNVHSFIHLFRFQPHDTPPINSCTASMLFLVFAAAYPSHPLRSCLSLSNARCWWIVA